MIHDELDDIPHRRLVKIEYRNSRRDACLFVYAFFIGAIFQYTFTYTAACIVLVILLIALVLAYRN